MKTKFMVFVLFLFVAGCQNTFEPDSTLKKVWTNELENTQPSHIPFGLMYEADSKKVIYVAADPKNNRKTDALIESLIETYKPQVVLCQGHTKEIIPPDEMRFKLHQVKPILKGASAERALIISNLSKFGISERDYEIYSIINRMNQIWQYEVESPKELKLKVEHYLNTHKEAMALHLTYGDIQKWFQEKTGHPMTEDSISDGILTAPMDPNIETTSYLQKISFYEDEIDDAHAMETLAKALREYDTVMIIRAASKYVVERDVLHKMLGVSQPAKVIN